MPSSDTSKRRYAIGILLLLGVVVLWVSSSFLINHIFSKQEFNKPFFLTYFNTGTFSLYLLIVFFQRQKDKWTLEPNQASERMSLILDSEAVPRYDVQITKVIIDVDDGPIETKSKAASASTKYSDLETAKLSLTFCILWFLANWSTNASLSLTTVGSSTILCSTSGIFTLLLGSFFKIEKFTWAKLLGIMISFGGVVLVGISSNSDLRGPSITWESVMLGDAFSLLGAFFYGCYTTYLKVKVGEENIDMRLFLGFVGLINLIIMIPVLAANHFLGIETFSFPPTSTVWLMLIVNGLLGSFLSDYLWIFAVIMTSPLVVTLGLSLTIPLAMMGDILINDISVSTMYGSGAGLVVIGFLFINYVSYEEHLHDTEE
ncbi:hypothetical protein DSO57_1027721 [Entomophthora muscae]|uniref:Uncharacterized protein n=2 Tax=Entomophthora muscae TaxID=34485 RepID=A0ACC2U097_9FUNG|nr:hypothetical protein DSO57_1027721 [Entomophthora muscae]